MINVLTFYDTQLGQNVGKFENKIYDSSQTHLKTLMFISDVVGLIIKYYKNLTYYIKLLQSVKIHCKDKEWKNNGPKLLIRYANNLSYPQEKTTNNSDLKL